MCREDKKIMALLLLLQREWQSQINVIIYDNSKNSNNNNISSISCSKFFNS